LKTVTNSLKLLVLGVWCLACVGCGGKSQTPTPEPTAPLPTAGIAAQQVAVLPLTLVAAEDSLRWGGLLGERRDALTKADSVFGSLLQARAPEVTWILPDALRRAARRAPGIAPDPDQMGSAILLHPSKQSPEVLPDPLRNELRTLAALAGSGGGRYVLVPAGLVFRRTTGPADARSGGAAARPLPPPDRSSGTAELTIVLADVRTGRVGFRTVARGEGDDPWTALTRAVKNLTPGLP
jgi:hypothetical protein